MLLSEAADTGIDAPFLVVYLSNTQRASAGCGSVGTMGVRVTLGAQQPFLGSGGPASVRLGRSFLEQGQETLGPS